MKLFSKHSAKKQESSALQLFGSYQFANKGDTDWEKALAARLGVTAVRLARSGANYFVSVDLGNESYRGGYVSADMSFEQQVASIRKNLRIPV